VYDSKAAPMAFCIIGSIICVYLIGVKLFVVTG
jgi:hypothetical protein